MEGLGGRKKRGYSRDVTVDRYRDYRLFAIGCEGGKREPEYFELFEHLSKRVKVDIIGRKERNTDEGNVAYETKSSPAWVLERVNTYVKDHDLDEEDQVWFVLDIDRWTPKDLKVIEEVCRKKTQLNVVFSNPCFEVWLYLHQIENLISLDSITCDELKSKVSTLYKGGYCPITFVQDVEQACKFAKAIDLSKGSRPIKNETKVYQLVEALLSFAPLEDKEYFFRKKIPQLLAEKKERLRQKRIIEK